MSNLLMDDRPIMFLPQLAKLLGSCERAIVLQQIHWLCNQPHNGTMIDGEKWVWGTYEEWCEMYFPMWTSRTLRRHITWLEKNNYLISCQPNVGEWDQTKHYRVAIENIVTMRQHVSTSKRQHVSTSTVPDVSTSIYRTETSSKTTTESSEAVASPADVESKPEENTKPILERYSELVPPGTITDGQFFASQGKAAKRLAKVGYTADDVELAYRLVKADPFWKDKPLHLASVAKVIGELDISAAASPSSSPTTITLPKEIQNADGTS